MINRKQIATMTLAAATILTSIPVMADDNTNVVTGNPTSVDTRVEATVPSSYQITVPKKITLTVTKDSSNGGYTGYADYKVNVQGDIAANEIITVTLMKDTIELNQSGKTSKSATVALDANELDSAAISGAAGKDVSGTVIASGLTAGSWSGTAGFSVNVVEKYGEDITINDPSTYGIPTSGDVTIPSVVTDSNGVKHRVTSNGFHAFLNCTGLTSITIPTSVTDIESAAFVNCSNLTAIIISNSVTNIGTGTFGDCVKLTSAILPDNIEYIEKGIFDGCSSFASVTYKGITYTSKSALKTALTNNNVTVSDDAFDGTALTD